MTSFINLMGNDVWSEANIVNRTEAILHGVVSEQDETILNRKVTGAILKQYTLTADDQADLARYAQASAVAGQVAAAARLDMALLREVLRLEPAKAMLLRPLVLALTEERENPKTKAVTTVTVNQAALDTDAAERGVAQAVVNSASTAANDLYLLRNPPPLVKAP